MNAAGLRWVITAGPTREFIDPVRFLSNPSSGRMGFALAQAAAAAGGETVLVAGPVELSTPPGVRRIDAVSAREMCAACEGVVFDGERDRTTVVIAAAAVADWRPAECAARKLKKREMSPVLRLVRNPDILKTLALRREREGYPKLHLVGFAAETGAVLDEARRKCREKALDMIVANDVSTPGFGFAARRNCVTLVYPGGETVEFPPAAKAVLARKIVRAAAELCG